MALYVHEHNHVLPHSAFRGQTPDEMYFGTGDAVPADLTARAAAARRARVGRPTARHPARRARYSARHDPRLLTAVRAAGFAHLCASRRPREEAVRTVARVEEAEPCPGSDLLFINRVCRLEWRELARKLQNVADDSSAK